MKEEVGMTSSKYVIYCISVLFVFSSCGKNNIPDENVVSYADYPFVSCSEFSASAILGDSTGDNISRGWEGELPPGAQNLPVEYPLDEIFLVSKDYSATDYSILFFPVYESENGKKVFDICFSAEGDKLWAKSGSDSILVANQHSFTSYFYSTDQLSTFMEKGSITTPGGTETYDPYGDRLFKSDELFFAAAGNQVMVSGIPITQYSLTMNRITNVLIPRFILCDEMEEDKKIYELSLEKFEKLLGPIRDWSIRAFIAGNKSAGQPYINGFPTEYTFQNGTNESGSRGTVSVSKSLEKFVQGMEHSYVNPTGGGVALYYGIGYHNSSVPFLLPANTTGKADICYSVYYKGDSINFKKYNTFRVEAISDLVHGQLKTVTVILDVDDFANAFKKQSTRSDGRVVTEFDSVFGEVTKIPYKLILD